MGATRAELTAREADGTLLPRTKVPTIKAPWRLSDGRALIDDLTRLARPLPAETPGWETIQLAHKRLGLSVARIVAAIREGALVAGQCADACRYHGICVECCAVDRLNSRQPRSPMPMDGEMNAAIFARSIGLRQKGAFLAPIVGVHTPATEALNPVMTRRQLHMTAEDVAAFHDRFTTPTQMRARTGLH
jgi:hypothetical protein